MTESPARLPTRDLIWDAANDLFRVRGYASTSIRDIATAAGVDPALVMRHFGSKEKLFLETMRLNLDQSPLLTGPIETFGERFIRFMVSSEERVRPIFLALVRASDADGVNRRMREIYETAFVEVVGARLDGDDIELRARLAASVTSGLLYALWVVGDERLATQPEAVVKYYGPLLQSLITPA